MNKELHTSSKYLFITALILLLAFSACDKDNNHPGHMYYPDMVDSRAYESFSENPVFEDNQTMRKPVEGTVPRGYKPLPYTKDLEDRAKAGNELANPVSVTEKNMERGRVLYNRFCLQCHGPNGDGQGNLYTSKLYPFPPASLVNDKVTNLKDGEIFHTITYGYGVMAEHGSMIRVEDRWLIVNYIRNNLQNQE